MQALTTKNCIYFLYAFTESLIAVSIEKERKNEIIAAAKIKKQLIDTPISSEKIATTLVHNNIIAPMRYTQSIQETREPMTPVRPKILRPQPNSIRPYINRTRQQPLRRRESIPIPLAVPQKMPTGFSIGKLEPLLSDATILSIECPGPEKKTLVHRYNGIQATQIILTQNEIESIITAFAENAKVPLAGGMLKVAVGNLMISAVMSQFVGSRFIITKIQPHNLPIETISPVRN